MERHDLDEHGSFAWLAHPDEFMERASTAVALDGGGWLLIDPLDAPGLDDALATRGEVRAVATLLNRHDRDAEAIAERHGAPRVFPRIMASRGAPIELPEVQERTLWKRLRWHEAALWLPDRQLLIAPEALGTAEYYRVGDERLAVHPLLRPWPPRRSLAGLQPRAISVGHGRPLTEGPDAALQDALRTSRRRLPKSWVHAFRTMRAARRTSS
jgi:hypothetical protein